MNEFDFTNFHTDYLFFREGSKAAVGRKTRVVYVNRRNSDSLLGMISWWGAWRQYTFLPCNNTVFNKGCMEDIIAVIDALMAERRKK